MEIALLNHAWHYSRYICTKTPLLAALNIDKLRENMDESVRRHTIRGGNCGGVVDVCIASGVVKVSAVEIVEM